MTICVVGSGYVGLVVGACLAETGNDVICADVDAQKIGGLNAGRVPIYEPGLDAYIERNHRDQRLSFTTDVAGAIGKSSVVFIAVGTPPNEDGAADLRHVLDVADVVGRSAKREMVIVTKSTVPVGTAAKVAAVISRTIKHPFHMVSNPEFLKEGAAIDDFMRPDRVVLGVETDHARSVMAELYAPFVRTGRPIIFMDIVSAELTKYAANAMLATRISFMNEIADICERVGADADLVRRGIGSDERIGASFLFPGPGYGGSCFPKDIRSLMRTAKEWGTALQILDAVDRVNERQKHRLAEKVSRMLGPDLSGKTIAVWGLAFKANTDDMRESPALTAVEDLLALGGRVVVHDPVALAEARRRLGDRVSYCTTSYDALKDADALVIATEWNEYRHPDFDRMKSLMRRAVVVDGRNLFTASRLAQLGFEYDSIGRAAIVRDGAPVEGSRAYAGSVAV